MKKTPLNELHRRLGARMVEFGGWEMPVQYSGVISEHLAVRSAAGLFDVSHMGEIEVTGKDAYDFLQYATTNDLRKLEDGQVQYTALCYEHGGVVDDLTLYRIGAEHFLLCVNAANTDKDFSWLQEIQVKLSLNDLDMKNRSDEYAQIALQGPFAARILKRLTEFDLDSIKFYRFARAQVSGRNMIISRTGYTGEDGFELYCAADDGPFLWQQLMDVGSVDGLQPAGLGARDTLRLEKGYALYGHEINADILPLEARLGWITKLGKSDFVGRKALLEAKEQGLKRQLVPLVLDGPGVPRENYPVYSGDNQVGYVTSGTMSPSLKQGIALALIDKETAASDASLYIGIRSRKIAAQQVTLPFVK